MWVYNFPPFFQCFQVPLPTSHGYEIPNTTFPETGIQPPHPSSSYNKPKNYYKQAIHCWPTFLPFYLPCHNLCLYFPTMPPFLPSIYTILPFFDISLITTHSDIPAIPAEPCITLLTTVTQIAANPIVDPSTPTHKCPTRTPGLIGTNTAFLVPEFVRKRFLDGWSIHVSLTYLTNKGCLLKDKSMASSSQDLLTIDNATSCILTTTKPLSDDGELDLTFDEWHQAWQRLLDLIKEFIPQEFLM